MTQQTQRPGRRIKTFVQRAGRITPSQQRALENLAPRYCLGYPPDPPVSRAFSRKNPLIVEIGFGNGDSLVEMARNNPDYNYLGIEVYSAGVGRCLLNIEAASIDNLLLIEHDAVEVVEHALEDHSIRGFQIFFPDPWHKKRHHKRRLIQPPFVAQLCRKLTNNGFIHCATDWEDYARHMLEVFDQNPDLTNAYQDFVPSNRHLRPQTKFEKRGQQREQRSRDLLFYKQPHAME